MNDKKDFPTLKNDRFLKALLLESVDVTPVWMMRQAGRYLPEYRAVREKAGGFMDLCTNPELACEVTLQPLRRFELDAAILFSDILTIPDAMGLGLYFEAGEGPRFKKTIDNEKDVDALPIINPEKDLPYVTDAVTLIRHELNGSVPLIGFSGSPWTLATYMIQGSGSKDHAKAKRMLYAQPEVMHLLLDKLAQSVTAYLNAQIEAGAQAVQIFDTWGGALSHPAYEEFSLKYMSQIVEGLIKEKDGQKVPVILFTKGGGQWLEKIASSGCNAIGLDWTTNLNEARHRTKGKVALQGNMDPTILGTSAKIIEKEVQRILKEYGSVGTGHVFNLGHGITPDIDPDMAKAFIDAVHNYSFF